MAEGYNGIYEVTGRHFLVVSEEELKRSGKDPAREIVPVFFGLQAVLTAVPEKARILVSGKSQFKLFVNGEAVLFGPLRSIKKKAYYDEIDIAAYLKAGENRIVMQVLSYPEKMTDFLMQGPNYCYGDDSGPGIMMEGVLGETDLADKNNWYVYVDPSMAFNDYEIFLLGSMEVVDGIKKAENPFLQERWDMSGLPHPADGDLSGYDMWGCLHDRIFEKRPLPQLYRKACSYRNARVITVAPGQKTEFVLDAGGLTTAYFRIRMKGGKGARLQFMYSESYYKDDENGKQYKDIRDDASGYIDGIYDEYIASGRDEIYEPFRFRTFWFVKVTVETADEAITLSVPDYIETAYPLENKYRPVFQDSLKEKLYDTALRTLQLCMHDTYEDCPYYEQLMYAGDSRLEMLFTYECSGDTRLPAYGIELFADSMTEDGLIQSRMPSRSLQIIPVFSLYFVLMLEDYIKETGDTARMAPHIAKAERIIETFLGKRTSEGLIAPQGYWDFFDWAKEWENGVPNAVRNGASALQNLLFVYTVQSLARILPLYHRKDLADYYLEEATEIQQLIRETCYNAEKGLFREGPRTEEYSQHTQVFAVLTELVKGEDAKGMMEKVLADESLVACSFVQRFYLFRALEKTGLYDRTEKLWGAWEEFLDLHLTTFPETQFAPRSDCHAWSAMPLYEFGIRH